MLSFVSNILQSIICPTTNVLRTNLIIITPWSRASHFFSATTTRNPSILDKNNYFICIIFSSSRSFPPLSPASSTPHQHPLTASCFLSTLTIPLQIFPRQTNEMVLLLRGWDRAEKLVAMCKYNEQKTHLVFLVMIGRLDFSLQTERKSRFQDFLVVSVFIPSFFFFFSFCPYGLPPIWLPCVQFFSAPFLFLPPSLFPSLSPSILLPLTFTPSLPSSLIRKKRFLWGISASYSLRCIFATERAGCFFTGTERQAGWFGAYGVSGM